MSEVAALPESREALWLEPGKESSLTTGRFLHRPHQHIADAPVAYFVTALHKILERGESGADLVESTVIVDGAISGFDRLRVDWIGAMQPSTASIWSQDTNETASGKPGALLGVHPAICAGR